MTDKRIFVTGGANGLGKAIAMHYAKAGYKVCIGDINHELAEQTLAELKIIQSEAMFLPCDVRELTSLEQVRDTLATLWGGVDIVVNNAGVGGSAGMLEQIPMEDWEWVMDINVLGVVRGCQVFLPMMKRQHSGHFVNIASAAGLMNAPRMANYNASKAAVISLSETIRLEMANFGIGVTLVCPSFFSTKLAGSIRLHNDVSQEWIEKVMARSPVTADDIAGIIFQAVDKNQFWLVPHQTEKRLWILKRWMPEFFFRQMLKRTRNLFKKT